MSVVQQRCPACAAPLSIPPGTRQIRCSYCGSLLRVEGQGGNLSVELADRVINSIEQSGSQTQAEVRRLQQTQELSTAEMRLANIQSEMRAIQRQPITPVSRRQLEELDEESLELQYQIRRLHAIVYPNSQLLPPATRGTRSWRLSPQGVGWLLFSFSGRANRVEYWSGIVVCFCIYLSWLVVTAILRAIGPTDGFISTVLGSIFSLVAFAQIVVLVWIGVAVSIKRFHDRGKAGWWVLIGFIPLIGMSWFLIDLGILPGVSGVNQYG
jgi:LSD1 subclass zinc finger protein